MNQNKYKSNHNFIYRKRVGGRVGSAAGASSPLHHTTQDKQPQGVHLGPGAADLAAGRATGVHDQTFSGQRHESADAICLQGTLRTTPEERRKGRQHLWIRQETAYKTIPGARGRRGNRPAQHALRKRPGFGSARLLAPHATEEEPHFQTPPSGTRRPGRDSQRVRSDEGTRPDPPPPVADVRTRKPNKEGLHLQGRRGKGAG